MTLNALTGLSSARTAKWAVALACASTFTMGGVIFGISSLYPTLRDQGWWSSLCSAELDAGVRGGTDMLVSQPGLEGRGDAVGGDTFGIGRAGHTKAACKDSQLVRYSLVSSIAFFLADAAAAPWGELADRAGPFVCMVTAVALSTSAFLLLAVGSLLRSDSVITVALLALGAAGPGVFSGGYVGGLELVSAFPELKAVLTAFEAAVFDGSALVFMIFQQTARRTGSGLAAPAVVWSGVCVIVGGAFCLVLRNGAGSAASRHEQREERLPSHSSSSFGSCCGTALSNGPDGMHADGMHAAAADVAVRTCTRGDAGGAIGDGIKAVDEAEGAPLQPGPAPQARSLRAVLLTPTNAALVSTMAIYTLISSFYVQSQIHQFELLFGEAEAERISTIFDLAFPIGGFCASFPVSQLLQRVGDREYIYWGITFMLVNAFSALTLLPVRNAQVCAAVLFGPMRCLQWACYFQFLANERLYPPELTGRALGFNNVAVAVIGDGVPYLLSSLVSSAAWGGGPTQRYFALKLALHLCLLLAAPLPLMLYATRPLRSVIGRPDGSDSDATEQGASDQRLVAHAHRPNASTAQTQELELARQI